jgi:hypothetical protein
MPTLADIKQKYRLNYSSLAVEGGHAETFTSYYRELREERNLNRLWLINSDCIRCSSIVSTRFQSGKGLPMPQTIKCMPSTMACLLHVSSALRAYSVSGNYLLYYFIL